MQASQHIHKLYPDRRLARVELELELELGTHFN
jgi:hypothetical protein